MKLLLVLLFACVFSSNARIVNKRAIAYNECRVGKDRVGIGEEVVVDQVKWKCSENGFEALACVPNDGGSMQVGTEVTDGGTVRSCRVRGYTVEYDEWAVGHNPIGEGSETPIGGANIKQPAQGSSNQIPGPAAQPPASSTSASTRKPAPAQSSTTAKQSAGGTSSDKSATSKSSTSTASPSVRTKGPVPPPSSGSGSGSVRISPIVVSPATPPPGQRLFTPGIVTVGFPLTILPRNAPSIDPVPLQITNCDVEGQQYKPGDTIRTTKFVLQCSETGLDVLACIATDGTEIKVGESKMLNERKNASCTKEGQQYKYREHLIGDLSGTIVFGPPGGPNSTSGPGTTRTVVLGPGDVVAIGAGGPVRPTAATQAPPSGGRCAFEGKNYANGEEWALPARYRYKCTNGRIEIIACVTGNGDELKVGQSDTYHGLHRVCEKHGPGVRYIGN